MGSIHLTSTDTEAAFRVTKTVRVESHGLEYYLVETAGEYDFEVLLNACLMTRENRQVCFTDRLADTRICLSNFAAATLAIYLKTLPIKITFDATMDWDSKAQDFVKAA